MVVSVMETTLIKIVMEVFGEAAEDCAEHEGNAQEDCNGECDGSAIVDDCIRTETTSLIKIVMEVFCS